VDQSKRGTQCIRKDKIDSDGGEWFIVWSTLGSRTAGERERERERGIFSRDSSMSGRVPHRSYKEKSGDFYRGWMPLLSPE